MINVNKCFISSTIDLKELRTLLIEKTQELFKAAGIDMPVQDIKVEEFENEVGLYLDCFSNLPAQTQYERDAVQAATEIGFTDIGYENMSLVCRHIFGVNLDHTFDSNASVVILEFYQESHKIMTQISNLYNEIDNMTAKEAKQSVAELYATLKNNYGWSE